MLACFNPHHLSEFRVKKILNLFFFLQCMGIMTMIYYIVSNEKKSLCGCKNEPCVMHARTHQDKLKYAFTLPEKHL